MQNQINRTLAIPADGHFGDGTRDALRLDDQIGPVEAGKSAVFMVLNEDLFNIDPYKIHDIVPEAVVMRGKCVKAGFHFS